MAYDPSARAEDGRTGGRWLGAAAWPLVVLLGWALFELTAQPALAVIALCLKFGWNDLRTALWLWRTDPRRGRGWACFFLYVSSGLWKVTLTGVLLIIILIVALTIAFVIAGPQAQPGVGVEDQCIAACLTGLLGSALAVPLTAAALVLALASRTRLWLNGAVHQARRAACWPPPDVPGDQVNRTGLLTLTALILTWLTALGATISVLIPLRPAGGNKQLFERVSVSAVGVGWGIGVLLIYWLQNLFERRVIARSPGDCWGRAPLTESAHPEDAPGADAPGSPLDVRA
jgi:hypothetical protein